MIVGDMIHQHIPLPFSFYEGSLKQLAGNDRYQLALNVYERFVADWLEPSPVTLSCLISFVAEVGDMGRAAGFFEKLSSIWTPYIRAKVEAETITYNAAISTCEETSHWVCSARWESELFS